MLTRRTFTSAPLAAAVAAALDSPASAAEIWASDWSRAKHAQIRLLAVGRPPGTAIAAYSAALEIALDGGFKTYWRDPGESGLPPVFKWSGSENLARVEVIWPAPVRFPDGPGYSIGYKDRVILPLAAVATDAAKPIVLRLDLDFAVCDKQCIPEKGSVALPLPLSGESPHIRAVGEAFARAPKRVALNEFPDGIGLQAVSHRAGDVPVLIATVVAPRYAKGLDLFVEAPDGAFFGSPKITPLGVAQPGNPLPLEALQYELPLEQKPRGNPVWDMRLTLVSDDAAIEHSLRLDGLGQAR